MVLAARSTGVTLAGAGWLVLPVAGACDGGFWRSDAAFAAKMVGGGAGVTAKAPGSGLCGVCGPATAAMLVESRRGVDDGRSLSRKREDSEVAKAAPAAHTLCFDDRICEGDC